MDLSVLYLAVPALSADLEPSSTQLLWIIDIDGFLLAGSLRTMGTLGDRTGRRRLLFTGRSRVRGRFAAGRLLDQRGAADRGSGAAGGRRGDPGGPERRQGVRDSAVATSWLTVAEPLRVTTTPWLRNHR
jgi:hypothetical protein